MGAKRKQHGAEIKARVAMAALAGDKRLAERASASGVPPTRIDRLPRKIGPLPVERDFWAGQPAIARLLKGER